MHRNLKHCKYYAPQVSLLVFVLRFPIKTLGVSVWGCHKWHLCLSSEQLRNYTGPIQIRCTVPIHLALSAVTKDVLPYAILPSKASSSIWAKDSILAHQLQQFSFFSSVTSIYYSLLNISIIFVILKKIQFFLSPSGHQLISLLPFITKFLEIVAHPCYLQFLFSHNLLDIEGFCPLLPTKLVLAEVRLTDILWSLIVKS